MIRQLTLRFAFSKIVDGNSMAHVIVNRYKQNIKYQREMNPNVPDPCLGIIVVGNNTSSLSYVSKKINLCQMNQIKYVIQQLPQDSTQFALLQQIAKLNMNTSVNGILLQLPLPDHIDRGEAIKAIDSKKDVDCLQPKNFQLYSGDNYQDGMIPCTPAGIIHILDTYNVNIRNLKVTIVGRGSLVGFPLSNLLIRRNAQVTICHKFTSNLEQKVRQADLVVACAGIRHLIQGNWIKNGAIVIDAGINAGIIGVDAKKIVGDVEFEQASRRASLITPVPGGVGPLTVAMLIKNTYTLWCRQNNLKAHIQESEGEYAESYCFHRNA